MATTRTGPNINWREAGSDVWNLMLDTARSKLIDVEMVGDERTVPDYTDLRTGNYPTQNLTGTAGPQVGMAGAGGAGGMNWLALAGVAAAAGALVWVMAD